MVLCWILKRTWFVTHLMHFASFMTCISLEIISICPFKRSIINYYLKFNQILFILYEKLPQVHYRTIHHTHLLLRDLNTSLIYREIPTYFYLTPCESHSSLTRNKLYFVLETFKTRYIYMHKTTKTYFSFYSC